MTSLKTLDTDFAAAMMARGARLDGWEKSADSHKVYWQLSEIDPAWINDYRMGNDGMTKYISARRMLINIVKSQPNQKKG